LSAEKVPGKGCQNFTNEYSYGRTRSYGIVLLANGTATLEIIGNTLFHYKYCNSSPEFGG
jgi:hypothetical protein